MRFIKLASWIQDYLHYNGIAYRISPIKLKKTGQPARQDLSNQPVFRLPLNGIIIKNLIRGGNP